ncbi:MAG: hypothetical protein ACRDHF_02980, partial [Tepidiformaceae bacterium]
LEVLEAAMLGVASVATAWSGYQATRWSGVQASDYTTAGALRAESIRQSNRQNTQIGIDVELFLDWQESDRLGQQALADELILDFTPELRTAFDAWLPGKDMPGAPSNPIITPEYVPRGAAEAADFERRAEDSFADGQDANQISDNYVLLGVGFALALFLIAMGGRFKFRRVHTAVTAFCALLITFGIICLAIFPIE